MSQDRTTVGSSIDHRRAVATAVVLALGFLALYHSNGDFLPGNDAVPNVYLPASVLNEGSLSFSPDQMPWMFTWRLHARDGPRVVRIQSWEQKVPKRFAAECQGHRTWGKLRNAGKLTLHKPGYYLVPSVDPKRRGYVGIYGPGAGLTALPFFATARPLAPDIVENKALVWYGGKFVAATCVALSVALIFLTLLELVDRRAALLIATAYGAGTCVWSMSSQTLWQSGPNVFFIALAAFCLTRIERSNRWAAGCGLAAACGVVCRPTTTLLVVSIGVYLIVLAVAQRNKRSEADACRGARGRLLAFLLAGLPLAVLLAAYNWHYLGSPLQFGQMIAGQQVAQVKLGTADAWRGSFFEGFYGLLASPSRGMLVYSPILFFGFWGAARLWRKPRFRHLRPLSVALALMVLLPAKWFDWHGGWSFGYRIVVDTAPLLALCGAAVVEEVKQRRAAMAMFTLLLAWSVGVQILGAFAYNGIGWNNRRAYLVEQPAAGKRFLTFAPRKAKALAQSKRARVREVFLDVDRKCNRRRLWSLADSQLLFYATHFAESRDIKKRLIEAELGRGE